MGKQIVKQPNGLFALWSTVVDDFVFTDATRDEIIQELLDETRREITAKVDSVIQKLGAGGKPYRQFTKTYDECIAIRNEVAT